MYLATFRPIECGFSAESIVKVSAARTVPAVGQ
jgi:hypothetical protein